MTGLLSLSGAGGSMLFPASLLGAEDRPANSPWDTECLIQQMEHADDATSVQTLRERCRKADTQASDAETRSPASETPVARPEDTKLGQRLAEEDRQKHDQFSVLSHRPNYLMVGAYNFSGTSDKAGLVNDAEQLDDLEVEIQLSLKVALGEDLLGLNDHLYVGYTNRSFWQAYNQDMSSPFRETNHEPEIWIGFENRWDILGWRNRMIDVGLSHHSNGRSDPYSRSWNRVYLRAVFEKENSTIAIKPWLRLPERTAEDDNPDITHYMGHSQFRFVTNQDDHQLSVMARNNFRFDGDKNKGAVELGYSYPIHRNVNAYVKWFYGYGETLIDYNVRNNRLSLGVQLGGWL
ncbi:MAG: phospholipase A [Hydrogenovibrio sp.]|uniref:phospholipase A n=1 Tax=Hydrogenovibrio sp. TaxID=2065821 RepID=UPI0028706C6C|nr:phospholipase A [Hydrogenovibrio sp.]MDR9498588.1 phospholipase A [Hydrogenovibrio sp.]